MTAEADGARQTGPALEKMIQFVLWLIPAVEKFPQRQRFLLGDRIQTAGLDILEGLIEATYSREKAGLLREANTKMEVLRWLVRMAKDRQILTARQYEFSSEKLAECGKMVGGWRKQAGASSAPAGQPG